MSINIHSKQDYSTLFAGLYTSSGSSSSNFLGINLSDYACIKSGSYGKLMKAYYSKTRSEEVEKTVNNNKTTTQTNKTASEDTTKTISKLKSEAASLSDAAEKLNGTDKDSLLAGKEVTKKEEDGTETKTTEYDRDAIYSAASSFVDKYNTLMASAAKSENTRVVSAYSGLSNLTNANKKALENIGITIGDNKKLTIDKDKFNEADIEKIQSVFQGNYGKGVQNRADLIEMYAQNDAAKASGLYGSTGTYTSQLSSGSLYSSIF